MAVHKRVLTEASQTHYDVVCSECTPHALLDSWVPFLLFVLEMSDMLWLSCGMMWNLEFSSYTLSTPSLNIYLVSWYGPTYSCINEVLIIPLIKCQVRWWACTYIRPSAFFKPLESLQYMKSTIHSLISEPNLLCWISYSVMCVHESCIIFCYCKVLKISPVLLFRKSLLLQYKKYLCFW